MVRWDISVARQGVWVRVSRASRLVLVSEILAVRKRRWKV
jgi:hypothetical protein